MRQTRNLVYLKGYRGFESLPFRHKNVATPVAAFLLYEKFFVKVEGRVSNVYKNDDARPAAADRACDALLLYRHDPS